jgi:hypothetical protein
MALLHDSYMLLLLVVVVVVVMMKMMMMMMMMMIVLTLYFDLHLGLAGDIFPSALRTKILYSFLFPSMNAIFIGIHTGCAQMQSSV